MRVGIFCVILVAFAFSATASEDVPKSDDRTISNLHWWWPHWPHHPKTTSTTVAPTTKPPKCPPWPLHCHKTTTSTTTTTTTEPTTTTTAEPTTTTTAEPTTTSEEPTSTSSSDEPSSSTTEKPTTNSPFDKSFQWVERDAGTLPFGCSFIYGGTASNRLLYVGRVNVSDQLVPAAIHHYGSAGNEYYTAFSQDGEIIKGRESVEWLCSDYGVAWVRVKDFSDGVLQSLNPIVIGRNSDTNTPTYACLSHSFYNNNYPPSVGQVVGNTCQFLVGNDVVTTNDFKWWHTLELLVSLDN